MPDRPTPPTLPFYTLTVKIFTSTKWGVTAAGFYARAAMAVPSVRDRSWVEGRLRQGATVTEIAADAAVSRQTAHTWLSRHGLHPPPRAKPRPSPARLRALYRRHESASSVAEVLEVSAGTAHRWLLDAAVKMAPAGRPRRPRADVDVARLRRRRAGGATLKELAEEFGVSPETVRRRLDDTDG